MTSGWVTARDLLAGVVIGAELGFTVRWLLESYGRPVDDEAIPEVSLPVDHQGSAEGADDVLCGPPDTVLTEVPRELPGDGTEAAATDGHDGRWLVRPRGRHFRSRTG